MKTCFIYKATFGEEVLYIGIADKLPRRLSQHKSSSEWYTSQDKIEFSELPNRSLCKLYETYLIKTLTPKFNKSENNGDDFSLMSFDESSIIWQEYKDIPYERPVHVQSQREDQDYSVNNENFLLLIEDNKTFLSKVEETIYDNLVLTFTFEDESDAEEFQKSTGLSFRTEDYNLCTSVGWKGKEVNFNIIYKGFDKEDTIEIELTNSLKQIIGE